MVRLSRRCRRRFAVLAGGRGYRNATVGASTTASCGVFDELVPICQRCVTGAVKAKASLRTDGPIDAGADSQLRELAEFSLLSTCNSQYAYGIGVEMGTRKP